VVRNISNREAAQRIYDLAVTKHGLCESDLFFDSLTFTLASGDEAFRKSDIYEDTSILQHTLHQMDPEAYKLLG